MYMKLSAGSGLVTPPSMYICMYSFYVALTHVYRCICNDTKVRVRHDRRSFFEDETIEKQSEVQLEITKVYRSFY